MTLRFRRAVGIDLGTTNSEIAMVPPSERALWLYTDRFGRKTVASAVAWDQQQSQFLVGNAARGRRTHSELPIESIKRKMGQPETLKIGPHQLAPEEISAKILGELASCMRGYLDQHPDEGEASFEEAVITVPAYFDAPQVKATQRAAELAGLGVLAILQEPTAAAIYHVWKNPELAESSTFLVYDLGGGTFDVSILRAVAGEYQVLAIDGDNFLGGDDFDRRFAEHLRKQLVERGYALELDLRNDETDRVRFAKLVHLAQEVKEALSSSPVTAVSKSNLLTDQRGEPVAIEAEFGREEYEALISGFVDDTLRACERALAASRAGAGVGIEDIDHVILVGGSTRVPLVERRVREALASRTRGQDILSDEVDACVALGAAVHAAVLGGTRFSGTEATPTLRISTSLATRKPELKLGFRLEGPPPSEAQSISFWAGEQLLAQAPLSDQAQRCTLPLPPGEADLPITCALQSALGAPLCEIPLTLYRSDAMPRPSKLTRAGVLAKDISVEIVRGQSRQRRVLLAKGAGLPAQSTHLFYTNDQSGSVVLPLLQGRLPLDTLIIELDRSVAVGTPVELTLRCDEAMHLEANAEVAGRRLSVTLSPREVPAALSGDEIEALLSVAERLRGSVPGVEGQRVSEEIEWLSFEIREALRVDPDKLAALARRLRGLVDEYGGDSADGLTPALSVFENTLARTRRAALTLEAEAAGLSRDEWVRRIDTTDDRARDAFEAHDERRWRRCNEELQAMYETLTIERLTIVSTSDPNYAERLAFGVAVRLAELEKRLHALDVGGDQDLRRLRHGELSRIASWLTEDLQPRLSTIKDRRAQGASVPDTVNDLSELEHELERVEHAIARVPSLGLSTDRGRA